LHNSYTPIDTAIGKAVEKGTISRRKATQIMTDLKVNKTITGDEVLNQLESKPNNQNFAFNKNGDVSDQAIKALMRKEELTIKPVYKKREQILTTSKKKTIGDLISDLKDKLPFFETRTGKALKEDALKTYAFDDKIKPLLRGQTFISDTSPWFDKALGITRENDGEVKIGPPSFKEAGSSREERIFDYFPKVVSENIKNDYKDDGKLSYLNNLISSKTSGKNRIDLNSSDVSVTAHELIHAIVSKRGIKRHPREFNKTWETLSKTDERLQVVDTILAELYKGIETDEFSMTNERMSYLGEMLGVGGLKAFPKELQQDYEGIFK